MLSAMRNDELLKHSNMRESHSEWKNPDRKEDTLYASIDVKFRKRES